MAQYKINLSCGHGTETVSLFGKSVERERKIEWMEQTRVCKDCYIKEQKEADAKADKIAIFNINSVAMYATIHLMGQIEQNSKVLRDLGYSWMEENQGILGMLSMSKPKIYLTKLHKIENAHNLVKFFNDCVLELESLGYKFKNKMNLADYQSLAEKLNKKEKVQEQIYQLVKPICPEFYANWCAEHDRQHWNGKFYGKLGSWNIYVSSKNYKLSDEQKTELEQFLLAIDKYNRDISQINNENK